MRVDQFEEVFQRHFSRVHGVVSRLVGDADEAEDLTLEAFWRLWRTPGVEDGSCGPWLYRVATRLGYNALRARTRREAHERAAGIHEHSRKAGGDPAGEDERRIQREQVRVTLRRLPARQAQILGLRMAGMSYREIAAAMNVKTSSVGSLLARAESEFEKVYVELGSADRTPVDA
jgi:RNA polymerase sigma-70 factor (ECF subfamily)